MTGTPQPHGDSPSASPTERTVACCQLALDVDRPDENLARVRDALERATRLGAQIIVLPELANSGYVFGDVETLRDRAQPADGAFVTELTDFARANDVVVVAGFPEFAADGAIYNSAALLDPDIGATVYRKIHLWDNEKTWGFQAGTALPPIVHTRHGRIATVICYDLEFPELVRYCALRGAQLLAAPVNWPAFPRPDGERPGEIVRVQAGASVNRMFIAAADRTGVERGQDWVGGSVITDADGFPVTGIDLGAEVIFTAAIDLADADDKQISPHNDVFEDRRTDLYALAFEDR